MKRNPPPRVRVVVDGRCPECGADRMRHLRTGETWCSDSIGHKRLRDAGMLKKARK